MEFINGDSVMEMINRDGPLKLRRALVITYEIARALEHVHAHRIIHRDIKPSNIMVNHKGVSKLCDLGFAKIDDEDVMVGMAGTTLGTPYYMSPEQARGRADLDGRSDLYSLGASLFHMLTRRAPFYGKNASAVMRKQITEPLNFRTREISLFGDDVVAIVQRMMAKDRDERYQSARDVMEALAPFLGHETIGTDLRHDSSSMTQLLAVEKAQILVIHDSLEGTPEVEAVLSGITREGFSPSVCSVEDLDEKELMSSDGVLIGIPDGKLSDAVEQLLQGTEALDGKVAGVFICGDSTSGGAALQAVQEGLLAAGTVLQGGLRGYLGQTKEPRDEGLYRAALEILGKQVCELARQRVAVGEV